MNKKDNFFRMSIILAALIFMFLIICTITVFNNKTYSFPDKITTNNKYEDTDSVIEFTETTDHINFNVTLVNTVNKDFFNTIVFTPTYIFNNVKDKALTLKLEKSTDNVSFTEVSTKTITSSLLNTDLIYQDMVNQTDIKIYYRLSLYADSILQDIKENNILGKLDVKTYKNFVFNQVDAAQEWTAEITGDYRIELWGAAGNYHPATMKSQVGNGSYTAGTVHLEEGTKLYVYTGKNATDAGTFYTPAFNGGGAGSGTKVVFHIISSGGGATDVRYFGNETPSVSDLEWNSELGLNSRIMVAAGGGGTHYVAASGKKFYGIGGSGGGLLGHYGGLRVGQYGTRAPGTIMAIDTGGYQTKGGKNSSPDKYNDPALALVSGGFGLGGDGTANWSVTRGICPAGNCDDWHGGGGGGGYYGGGAGTLNYRGANLTANRPIGSGGPTTITIDDVPIAPNTLTPWEKTYSIYADCHSSGAGGSSYISGYNGSIAITSSTDRTPKCTEFDPSNTEACSEHYSGIIFSDTVMIDGDGYDWDKVQENYSTNEEYIGFLMQVQDSIYDKVLAEEEVKSTFETELMTKMPSYEDENETNDLGVGNTSSGHAKITLLSEQENDGLASESILEKSENMHTITVIYQNKNGEKLCDDVTRVLAYGESYTTDLIDFSDYEFDNVTDNKDGIMPDSDITVIYTYRYITSKIVVHHYLVGTTTKLNDDEIYFGKLFDSYSTSPLLIDGYELVNNPINKNGEYSNDVQEIIYYYDLLKNITVTKKIKVSDLNLYNGEPNFTFKLVSNNTLYKIIVFDKDYVSNYLGENPNAEYIEKSVTFDNLVSNTYLLSEDASLRYSEDEIVDIVSGTKNNNVVTFNLMDNKNGSATFVNDKISNSKLTDNSLSINNFKYEKVVMDTLNISYEGGSLTYGDTIDRNTLKVEVLYSDGSKKVIDSDKYYLDVMSDVIPDDADSDFNVKVMYRENDSLITNSFSIPITTTYRNVTSNEDINGNIVLSSNKVLDGGIVTVSARANDGYTNTGIYVSTDNGSTWSDSLGIGVINYKVVSDVIFKASFEIASYTITLDQTEADVSGDLSVEVLYGQAIPSVVIPERVGADFLGYYTETAGQGEKYINGDGTSLKNYDLYEDITLYAFFEESTYKIYFNGNGGTCIKEYNETFFGGTYGELTTCERGGYTFGGWYTSPTSGDLVSAIDTYNETDDSTIYAHWNANDYTLNLDANGGDIIVDTVDVTYDSAIGSLDTPYRDGYTFDGWYTLSEGGELVTSASIYNMAEDSTIYAHWKKASFRLGVNPNGGVWDTFNTTQYFIFEYQQTKEINVPTREGYTFTGWTLLGDSSTMTSLNGAATFTMGYENATLTANWEIVDEKFEIKNETNLVSILYSTWFDYMHNTTPTIYDNTNGPGGYSTTNFVYWSKPALDYYDSTNKTVIREHLTQLADAGIDFLILDITNVTYAWINDTVLTGGNYYLYVTAPTKALLDTMTEMRSEGLKVPKVVPWIKNIDGDLSNIKVFMNLFMNNYDVSGLLESGFDKESWVNNWVYWNNKPFIITTEAITEEDVNTIASASGGISFTTRAMYSDRVSNFSSSSGMWAFLQYNNTYVANSGEEISVAPAVQQNYMSNTTTAKGRENGKTFYNQWVNAFNNHPKFVVISSWNEWGSEAQYVNGSYAFTDNYNENYSRDIEPENGALGDQYLKWMKDYISAYKANLACPTLYN